MDGEKSGNDHLNDLLEHSVNALASSEAYDDPSLIRHVVSPEEAFRGLRWVSNDSDDDESAGLQPSHQQAVLSTAQSEPSSSDSSISHIMQGYGREFLKRLPYYVPFLFWLPRYRWGDQLLK